MKMENGSGGKHLVFILKQILEGTDVNNTSKLFTIYTKYIHKHSKLNKRTSSDRTYVQKHIHIIYIYTITPPPRLAVAAAISDPWAADPGPHPASCCASCSANCQTKMPSYL